MIKHVLYSIGLGLITISSWAQSTGTSCASALTLYPAATGDCSNASGPSLAGQYMCETGDCALTTMPASGGGVDGSCTSDNDASQTGVWIDFTATANNITLTNLTDYSGPGATDIEKKDYVIFSGSCGSLTQIGCAANVANGGSTTVTGLTVGQTYKIWVTRSATSLAAGCSTCNAAATCLTSTVPYNPTNESCATATTLATGVTLSSSNAETGADGPICSGSVENDVWYKWCAPSTWPVGQLAYVSVYDQVCNSSSGLQLSVWNTGSTCPTSSASGSVVCANPGVTTAYYYTWTAVANTCYYITLDGFGGTACSYNITVGNVAVLPIQLTRFDVARIKNRVDISWEVTNQINNDYFTVERSFDGNVFEAIQVIDGDGTTSETKAYTSEDINTHVGTSYYRIRQTDYDGNVEYSTVKSVNYTPDELSMTIYPNPSNNGNVYIDVQSPEALVLNVYDITGKVVYTSPVKATASTPAQFNLNLQEGMYTVVVLGINTFNQKKLIISK